MVSCADSTCVSSEVAMADATGILVATIHTASVEAKILCSLERQNTPFLSFIMFLLYQNVSSNRTNVFKIFVPLFILLHRVIFFLSFPPFFLYINRLNSDQLVHIFRYCYDASKNLSIFIFSRCLSIFLLYIVMKMPPEYIILFFELLVLFLCLFFTVLVYFLGLVIFLFFFSTTF